MGVVSRFVEKHRIAVYGTTTLAICGASAYGSLASQPGVTGQDLEVLIRSLPDELLVSSDLWTTTKAAAISFSVNRLLKKKLEATIFGSAFESTLEFIQYYLPSRFFDPVDFIYIFLGSMIGANIDDFGSKVLNNLTRLKYE